MFLLLFLALSGSAQATVIEKQAAKKTPDAKPVVVDWIRVPFEPFVVTEGAGAGKGVIDQVMYILQQRLPGYAHHQRIANVARRNRLIRQGELTCNIGMRKGSDRYNQGITFSDSLQSAPGVALITRKDELALPAISIAEIGQKLQQQQLRLGLIQGRSYGVELDAVMNGYQSQILWRSSAGHLSVPLINMMLSHRIDAIIDYPWKFKLDPRLSPYLPYLQITNILDTSPASAYVGCSDTKQGRDLIEKINSILISERKLLDDFHARNFGDKQ